VLTLIVVPVVYLGIERMRQVGRKLMFWMFRLDAHPDPVLEVKQEEEIDRAAAE